MSRFEPEAFHAPDNGKLGTSVGSHPWCDLVWLLARRRPPRGSEQLVGRHRDVVFRLVARIVGDDEAEDVTQGTLVETVHRLGRFGDHLRCARGAAVRAPTR